MAFFFFVFSASNRERSHFFLLPAPSLLPSILVANSLRALTAAAAASALSFDEICPGSFARTAQSAQRIADGVKNGL